MHVDSWWRKCAVKCTHSPIKEEENINTGQCKQCRLQMIYDKQNSTWTSRRQGHLHCCVYVHTCLIKVKSSCVRRSHICFSYSDSLHHLMCRSFIAFWQPHLLHHHRFSIFLLWTDSSYLHIHLWSSNHFLLFMTPQTFTTWLCSALSLSSPIKITSKAKFLNYIMKDLLHHSWMNESSFWLCAISKTMPAVFFFFSVAGSFLWSAFTCPWKLFGDL